MSRNNNKEYVCHKDTETGWRKTIHISQHGVVAHTEQHHDKVGTCEEVRQAILDDYMEASSLSPSNPCMQVTCGGLELIGDQLSPFEGCYETTKDPISVDIEIGFDLDTDVNFDSPDFENNCNSGNLADVCWPELCDLRGQSVLIKFRATGLECRPGENLSKTWCYRGSINVSEDPGNVPATKRDVYGTRTNWKACGNNLFLESDLSDTAAENYFKSLIDQPVEEEGWCIQLTEVNRWFYEDETDPNEEGCFPSEGYPKFHEWVEEVSFSVPYSVSVVVGTGGGSGTGGPSQPTYGPYVSSVSVKSKHGSTKDEHDIYQYPADFSSDNGFSIDCLTGECPLSSSQAWQARLFDSIPSKSPVCAGLSEEVFKIRSDVKHMKIIKA